MPSIRPVHRDRPDGPFRIEAKKTITNPETGEKEQLRWSWTRDHLDDPEGKGSGANDVAYWAKRDLAANVDPYKRYADAAAQLAAPEDPTVGQWVRAWQSKRRVAETTRRIEGFNIKNHILSYWEDDLLTDDGVTREAVQDWVTDLHEVLAPSTVRQVAKLFRIIIEDAVVDRKQPISHTPFVRIRYDPKQPTGRFVLDPDEVGLLLAGLTVQEACGWTLAFSGARVSELTRRSRVDWDPEEKRIVIPKLPSPARQAREESAAAAGRAKSRAGTETPRPARRTRTTAAKTAAGVRHLYLCDGAAGLLDDYLTKHAAPPLFISAQHVRVHPDTVRRALRDASRRVGLPRVTPHIFRHSVKTWLHDDKIHPRAIDELIGHESQGMDAIYVHVTPLMRQEREAAMQARWLQAMAAFQKRRADVPVKDLYQKLGRPPGARTKRSGADGARAAQVTV